MNVALLRTRRGRCRWALGLWAVGSLGASRGPAPAGQAENAAFGDRPILRGHVTKADLQKPPFAEWFESQYSRYQPTAPEIESLRGALKGVSIEAYFGTWCGDSRRQIPRLLRLLDLASGDEQRIDLVALSDRPMEFKQAPGRPELKREVHRTPTVVLMRDGAEIGRIVETPAKSLEADLLAILEGHGPPPKYGAEAYVHHLFTDLKPDDAIKAVASAGPEILKRSDPDSLWHYAEHDLLKNGRAREAKAVLELHLKLNPQSVEGFVLMSDALVALGRKAEALEAVDHALAIEPGNGRALRAKAKLKELSVERP